ncbi:MAG TPA: DegV family protein [Dehalococcoidia bacterium]|nr:DegV family protein [Dehalococcoidia bacterium]
MAVKIVTDSAADIPPELLKEFDITVVPLYVRFGNDVFKDKVDISNEEFYKRLVSGGVFPATSQPTPLDFKQVYEELAKDADGIVSVHLSAKLSGTIQSALQARDSMQSSCPIEIIDTLSITIGQGMVCLEAAKAAKEGAKMEDVVKVAREAVPEIHFMVIFDTLKYLAKGGRIGKAKSMMGAMLNIKPLIGLKDGEVIPMSKARSYSKAMEQQYEFIEKAVREGDVKGLSIMYNTSQDAANALADRIAPIYPRDKILMGEIGPILGTHGGPDMLVVCIRGNLAK